MHDRIRIDIVIEKLMTVRTILDQFKHYSDTEAGCKILYDLLLNRKVTGNHSPEQYQLALEDRTHAEA